MIVALALILTVLLAADLVVQAFVISRRPAPGPRLTGKTVAVTYDDQTVRGIVVADHTDRLTLTEAFYASGGIEHPLGGLVHIPRAKIASIQEPEA